MSIKRRIEALTAWRYAHGLPKKKRPVATKESEKQRRNYELELIFYPLSKKRELFTKSQKATVTNGTGND